MSDPYEPQIGDPDDPWVYFGSFSKEEVSGAEKLLTEIDATFKIIKEEEQESYDPDGWTGPYGIWVHEKDEVRVPDVLIPYFESCDKNRAEQ